MSFTAKAWADSPAVTTPLSAAALVDLETRVTDYSDARLKVQKISLADTLVPYADVDRTGVTNASAAIQGRIDYAVGGSVAAGVAAARFADVELVAPAGYYLLDAPLDFVSVLGLTFIGAGPGATEFRLASAFSGTSAFNFNGTTSCRIGGFSIASGAGSCTNAINIDWVVAQSARSSQNCTFFDIDIYAQVNFVNGVAIGTTLGSADVYNHRFIGVRVYGGQSLPINFTGNTTNLSPIVTGIASTAGMVATRAVGGQSVTTGTIVSVDSSTQITMSANAFATTTGAQLQTGGWHDATKWQAAFKVGQGSTGNVIQHLFVGCNAGYCVKGLWVSGSGAVWQGGAIQSCSIDVYCSGSGYDRPIHINGIRSENSGSMLDCTNGGKQDVCFSNCGWFSPNLRVSRAVATWAFGGHLRMTSVTIAGTRTQLPPKMVLGAPSSFLSVIIDQISIDAASPVPSTWITVGGTQMTYTVRHVTPLTSGEPTALTMRGPYSNRDRTSTATDLVLTLYDTYVGVTSTAAARAITLPACSAVPDGHEVVVKDESGLAGTNNITVSAAGANTIEGAGSVVISANYGSTKLKKVTSTTWVVAP